MDAIIPLQAAQASYSCLKEDSWWFIWSSWCFRVGVLVLFLWWLRRAYCRSCPSRWCIFSNKRCNHGRSTYCYNPSNGFLYCEILPWVALFEQWLSLVWEIAVLSCCKQVVSHSAKDNNKVWKYKICWSRIECLMLLHCWYNDAVSHCERVHVPAKQWFVDGLARNIRKRLAFNTARRGSIPEPLSNYRETCMHFIFILFSPGGRALATIDFRLYTCCWWKYLDSLQGVCSRIISLTKLQTQ